MDFNINSFDLLMVAASVMTYAIGAAIWTCFEVPVLMLGTPALGQATTAAFSNGEQQ